MKQARRAVLMLLLGCAFWGVSFPVMKALSMQQMSAVPDASEWFHAATTMVLRFALAAVVMVVVCAKNLRALTKLEVQLGVGLGLTAGAGTLLQMVGLNSTLASTSAFLTQFYVLIIPLALAVVRSRLPAWRVAVSCTLVIIGMGILCKVNLRDIHLGQGEWLTLAASVIFAGQILWLDRSVFRDCDKMRATLVMFVTITAMFVPVTLTMGNINDVIDANSAPAAIVLIVVLALICSVGAFGIMNQWQPKISPTQAGLIYCVEPIFASLYALFLPAWLSALVALAYPNERLTVYLLVGGALITAANILIQFDPRKEGQ